MCGTARPPPPPEWWSGAFKQAIASFGHVVAVLDPWDAPVPLTRAWCLWELLCAVEGNTRLEVTLSPAQATAFATPVWRRRMRCWLWRLRSWISMSKRLHTI